MQKNQSQPISISNEFIVRLPHFSFDYLKEFLATLKHSGQSSEAEDAHFKSLFDNAVFCEAIYTATPNLYKEFEKWVKYGGLNDKKVKRLKTSLLKYLIRMSFRTTPFGLFAGGGIGQINEDYEGETQLKIPAKLFDRYTRLDMLFVCKLVENICQRSPFKEHLKYFNNSSIYELGERWRYVEQTKINKKEGKYVLSSVDQSYYLNDILEKTKTGCTLKDLIAAVADEDATEADIAEFVQDIVDAQLLCHELEANISGEHYWDRLLEFVQRVETIEGISPKDESSISQKIIDIQNAIYKLDENRENPIQAYLDLIEQVEGFDIEFDKDKLLQIDSVYRGEATISKEHVQAMKKALKFLNNLTVRSISKSMNEFVNAFQKRYEGQTIPLLEALDPESGIGYLQNVSTSSVPLVDNLALPNNQNSTSLSWNPVLYLLFEKLKKANKDGKTTIELTDKDLEKLEANHWNDLPTSFNLICQFVETEKGQPAQIMFKGIGNASAVRLHTRFTYVAQWKKLVKDIIKIEQEKQPEHLLAELVHLPASRVGNVLYHPNVCEYEIPFLSKSTLSESQQITLQDLYIKVEQGKARLWSKKLQKYILPKLCTAHNYKHNSLPVYHFLAELEIQGKQEGLGLNWGFLSRIHHFVPRVTYKNVILRNASWSFQRKDFEAICKTDDKNLKDVVTKWRTKYNIPSKIIFQEFDHVMYIDLEVEWSTKVFIQTIKSKPDIRFFEFLESSVKTNGVQYNAEYYLTVINNSNGHSNRRNLTLQNAVKKNENTNVEESVQRKFVIGDEWLYFKVYAGHKTLDAFLSEQMPVVLQNLKEQGLIKKWFFIRYNDPENHLRLRFLLTDKSNCGQVINIVNSSVKKMIEDGHIYKVMTDTYIRELERYGANTIHLAESLFGIDSQACVEHLPYLEASLQPEQDRWLLAMLRCAYLLDDFELDLTKKTQLLSQIAEGFKREFNADGTTKNQLGKMYRNYRSDIEKLLSGESLNEIWTQHIAIFQKQSKGQKTIANEILELTKEEKLQLQLSDLLSSYLHMSVNRMVPEFARKHELVIYDFLHQYYHSQLKRAEKKQKMIEKNENV